MALFYNTLQPVLDSLSLKLVKKNPAFSYGTLRIAGAAGWAFTGIINGQLIDAMNTTVIFVVSAVSMLLTFIFAFTLQKDNDPSTEPAKRSLLRIKVLRMSKMYLTIKH